MVERDSNGLLIYPVSYRTEETLLPIIERHVEKGATIYSDGWLAYCKFNEAGYEHFTVIHKYYFKKTYVNTKTQDIVDFIQIVSKVLGKMPKTISGKCQERK